MQCVFWLKDLRLSVAISSSLIVMLFVYDIIIAYNQYLTAILTLINERQVFQSGQIIALIIIILLFSSLKFLTLPLLFCLTDWLVPSLEAIFISFMQLTAGVVALVCESIIYLLEIMTSTSIKEGNDQYILSLKTVTWQKDSHSLFDYEFNKNVIQNTFEFPLTPKYVYIYRNNTTSEVSFTEHNKLVPSTENTLQLLGCFNLKEENKKFRLEFFSAEHIKNLDKEDLTSSGASNPNHSKEEGVYLIVRSLKNKNNENKGYKLAVGQIIKLGRVEYLVTSINNNTIGAGAESKSKFWMNNKKIVVDDIGVPESPTETLECKYCMLAEGTEQGEFLCKPCKCSGTCGLVHFHCLQKWNQSKVKKEVVGGTIQYNFQKFYCEVCKEEYPRFIEKDGVEYELMPIEKPTGQHIMLQGVSEKANNMMVIQNIPADGIKIGRGHECQIRITDISVSRNHARIDKIQDDYYVFDNKSKFGTLVKEDRLMLEVTRIKQGIQIGRTVITFEKTRKG